MRRPEFHYRWDWQFQSTPEALWPLVADTNRFNRDVGVPEVERRAEGPETVRPGRRRLRLHRFGVAIAWEEEPFEWTRPSRFGVVRRYTSGPVAMMRVSVELTPSTTGGCHLAYQIWAQPRTWLGLVAIPVQIGLLSARRFETILRQYDRLTAPAHTPMVLPVRVRFAPGGRERLAGLRDALLTQGADSAFTARLIETIEHADDAVLLQLRPYVLADAWGVARHRVLELCLWATRVGLLEFRWKLLCPLCRGSRDSSPSLRDVQSRAHCESCHIDLNCGGSDSEPLTGRRAGCSVSLGMLIYAAIGIVGFLFLLVMLFAGEFGGGDHDIAGHDVSVDHGDAGHGGPGIFSARIMAAFLTAFGVGGIVGRYYDLSHPAASGVGVLCGAAMSAIVYQFAKLLYSQQASSEIRMSSLVGRSAEVAVSIPAGGVGQVSLMFGGERTEHVARSADGQAVPRGAEVMITGLRGDSLVVAPTSTQAPGGSR